MFGLFKNRITNQGHHNTIIQQSGLTIEEARIVALDVFKANFYELSENAARMAVSRAEQITDKFLDRFYNEIPHLKQKLEEPSVQSSIFNTQKEFAKTGDLNLEDRLLELLIQRIKAEERSLKQIVLDEAIAILPKLTNDQINVITLILSIVYLNHNINNINGLNELIEQKLIKFLPNYKFTHSFFNHLQYSGCCIIHAEAGKFKPIEEVFWSKYKGLFSKGFTVDQLNAQIGGYIGDIRSVVVVCLRNTALLQINAIDNEVLETRLNDSSLIAYKDQFISLFDNYTMQPHEIKEDLISINPKMSNLFNVWNEHIKLMNLTSVGFAIASINYNTVTKDNLDLLDYYI